MLIAISTVAVLGIIGLTASNLFLIFVVFRLKLLEKSTNISEYKDAIAPTVEPIPPQGVVEIAQY